MIELPVAPVVESPYEHVVVPDFLPRDLYEAARATFPICEGRGGPTHFSAFWGDPDFDRLVTEDPAWSALHQAFQSQAFVDYCVAQYGHLFRKYGCRVDLEKAVYVPFQESRAEKERRHMEDARPAPHELWVRLDIAQGRNGYDRGPHLDHRRRLVSMLIYMCDADEIGLEGGELVLHGGRPGRPNPIGSATLRPRHNLMVGFACVPHSWHAVTKTTVTRGYRNFIQVQLSSSEDAWPA